MARKCISQTHNTSTQLQWEQYSSACFLDVNNPLLSSSVSIPFVRRQNCSFTFSAMLQFSYTSWLITEPLRLMRKKLNSILFCARCCLLNVLNSFRFACSVQTPLLALACITSLIFMLVLVVHFVGFLSVDDSVCSLRF